MQALSAERSAPGARANERREVCDVIVFCALVARWQLRRWAWFALGQPWAWSFAIVRGLRELPG
eukprot:8302045-Alexandrium_andersonii.AAC.1